jgi:hypothetical protein
MQIEQMTHKSESRRPVLPSTSLQSLEAIFIFKLQKFFEMAGPDVK